MRCELKLLVLTPGLDAAAIRVVERLGRYFAPPVASRFYRVSPEVTGEGRARPSAVPVPDLASANRLELVLSPGAVGDPAWEGEPNDPGFGSQRLLVEVATPPDAAAPPAVWLVLEVDDASFGGLLEVAERSLAWCREELEADRLLGARFAEKGGATAPGPRPPLAADALVLCVEQSAVRREYGELDVYLEAFSAHEAFGERLLVSRAFEADPRVRRRRMLASNALLARHSRPRRTLWVPALPPPMGLPFDRPVVPSLRRTATEEPGPMVIYACSLPAPDMHIDPAEVAEVQALVSGAEPLPDGRFAAQVSVVFDDEDTARREARPLLDVGAALFVKDDAGSARPFSP